MTVSFQGRRRVLQCVIALAVVAISQYVWLDFVPIDFSWDVKEHKKSDGRSHKGEPQTPPANNDCTTKSRRVKGTDFNKLWPNYIDMHKVWSIPAEINNATTSALWHPSNFSKVCAATGDLGPSLYAPPRYDDGKHRPTGLRIAMIGDSLTRYQFVMLIHYLHTGHWIHDSMQPNLLVEKTMGGEHNFPLFFRALEDYFEHDHLVCDCYRGTNKSRTLLENQYYIDQECHNNTISFFGKYGSLGLRGYHDVSDINDWSQSMDKNGTNLRFPPSAYEQGTFRWWYSDYEPFLRNVLAKLEPRPRVVVINEGVWPNAADHLSNETVVRQIRDIIRELGMVSVYKSTTKRRRNGTPGLFPHDELCCRIFDHCLRLDWTACVPKKDFADQQHFHSYANLRFNEQLLELLEQIGMYNPAGHGVDLTYQ